MRSGGKGRMRRLLLLFAAAGVLLCPSADPRAREVARDAYLKQVPLGMPQLVPQTAASDALHLYGVSTPEPTLIGIRGDQFLGPGPDRVRGNTRGASATV
jgi:hypothetical protein